MKNRQVISIFSLTLGLMLLCTAAKAQEDDNSMTVEAGVIRFNSETGNSIFEGNVLITRGGLQLWADTVEHFQAEEEEDYIVAKGSPVKFLYESPESGAITRGSGDQTVYMIGSEELRMIGNVVIQGDRSTLRTHEATYDTKTGEVRAISTTTSNADEGRQKTTVILDDD